MRSSLEGRAAGRYPLLLGTMLVCLGPAVAASDTDSEAVVIDETTLEQDLSALDRQMGVTISQLEHFLEGLEATGRDLDEQYAATGDPDLLRRRDETERRVESVRETLEQTRGQREHLGTLMRSASDGASRSR